MQQIRSLGVGGMIALVALVVTIVLVVVGQLPLWPLGALFIAAYLSILL